MIKTLSNKSSIPKITSLNALPRWSAKQNAANFVVGIGGRDYVNSAMILDALISLGVLSCQLSSMYCQYSIL